MIGAIVFAAATVAHPTVEACAAAVRAESVEALKLCVEPKVKLFEGSDSLSPECRAVLLIGRSSQQMPASRRGPTMKKFEKAYTACLNPSVPTETPDRETVKLWD